MSDAAQGLLLLESRMDAAFVEDIHHHVGLEQFLLGICSGP